MDRRFQRLILLGLLLMSVVLPTAPTSHAAVSQMRALWVDAFNSGIKTPQQIEQLVADARRGGFNALIVQVRRRGDAFYLSGIEPRSQDPTLAPAPFDPLATLISTAQAQGIELHAWIAVLPIWRESLGQPSDPSHVYWQHGPHVAGSDNWVALGVNGESSVDGDTWLDPGHPAVVNYTAAVVRDLLERYPNVNGLHLDLIRYPSPQFGYNPVSVARFNEQFGRSGQPEPNDPLWKNWRRDQVTHLVRRIYLEAAQVAPYARVSAAVTAMGKGPNQAGGWENSDPYNIRLQDWRYWLLEGIIDTAIVMNYDREHVADQYSWYRDWVGWETQQAGRRSVVVGYGAWLNSNEGNRAQIAYALNAGAQGVAAYAYSSLANEGNRAQALDALAQHSFATPATMPSMPWKVETGRIVGDLAGLRGLTSFDNQEIFLSGPIERSLRSDGGGWFAATDLPAGWYRVTLRLPDGKQIEGGVEVRHDTTQRVNWHLSAVYLPSVIQTS